MANDKEITIGLKTTADTAGAEKTVDALKEVPKAIEKIPDSVPDAVKAVEEVTEALDDTTEAARKAQRELDVIEAQRRKAARDAGADRGVLGTDISGAVDQALGEIAAKAGFGKQMQAARALVSADAIAIGGSFAAIGMAAVKSYELVSGTVDGYRKLMADAAANGEAVGEDLRREVEAMEQTLGPLTTVVDFVAEKWRGLKALVEDPIDTISGLGDLRESFARVEEMQGKLLEQRKEMASANQQEVARIYGEELVALREQEATLQRIAALRREFESVEMQRANNQVRVAQQTGGDVELAKANALATELRIGLAGLEDDLGAARQSVETAKREMDVAGFAYQKAVENKLSELDPEKFAALAAAFDQTQRDLTAANDAVADQERLFKERELLLLENAEIKLRDLDAAAKGVDDAAARARDGIFETIKEKFAGIGSATGEVGQALDKEREQTTTAIQGLAPKPEDTAKITGAVGAVGDAINEQGNATVTALAGVTALVNVLVGKVNNQQAQINQIQGRLR